MSVSKSDNETDDFCWTRYFTVAKAYRPLKHPDRNPRCYHGDICCHGNGRLFLPLFARNELELNVRRLDEVSFPDVFKHGGENNRY
ncbi:hypothetical protein TNCT_194431 [Trichonephila clavata]|uniref:Uncharacterized protein n=1 Tax=Trichonephila clavata TaxID=2740835 RepID=A0A8X6M6D6_TRICU|nr:hypothetical protein TNCT_194431 [Trichonephila clavata]